jgi:aspartate racemase
MLHEPHSSANPGGSQRELWNSVRSLVESQRESGSSPAGLAEAHARNDASVGSPASFGQQRLWFLDQLHPGSSLHNLTVAHRLMGRLDQVALARALDKVVERHHVLHTTFHYTDGQLLQVVGKGFQVLPTVVDLSSLDPFERQGQVERRSEEEARRPFDLMRGPLLRASLLRLAGDDHVLLVSVHHAVFDGWSFEIFMAELADLYGAFSRGLPSPLAALPLQYADAAMWQRDRMQGENLERLLAYWRHQLAGPLPVLELPTDRPRAAVGRRPSATRVWRLPGELTIGLRRLSDRTGATLFITLLAGFTSLMYRLTGETDVTIGCPISGRSHPELRSLVGLFVNPLPLRTALSGQIGFGELIGRVGYTATQAFAHQELPLELLVQDLNPPRRGDRPPLFQVVFGLQNVPRRGWELEGLEIESWNVDNGETSFDLTVLMVDGDDGLGAEVSYDANLFEAASVDRLLGQFATLLSEAVCSPGTAISALSLLTEAERKELLSGLNQTTTVYPRDASVQELFTQQVARAPDAIAVCEGPVRISYRTLDERAQQLARRLIQAGVRPGDRIGLRLRPSAARITALLAILRAGAAYVPVELDWPMSYTARLLSRVGVDVVIADDHMLQVASGRRLRFVHPEPGDSAGWSSATGAAPGLAAATEIPLPVVSAESAAAIMFTSGSSGEPKAVEVTHRGIVRLVASADYAQLDGEQVFLHLAPLSFDASTFEIWGALLTGARLVVFGERPLSLERVGDVIHAEGVTILWLTAGLFDRFVDRQLGALRSLRQLLVGGDVVSPDRAERFVREAPGCRLVNCYGPTENTTFTCFFPVEAGTLEPGRPLPIGRPIANTRVYVLDEHMQPVPPGVDGELYIGGDGVALGYVDDPELTAARFPPDPFAERHGERLYRSGDRARWHSDGNLRFLGRTDNQVKIRGFRVEPGEVEAALRACRGVADAAVVPRTSRAGGRQLVSYVEPTSAVSAGDEVAVDADFAADLRDQLRRRLPSHLVPSQFVLVRSLPLTSNGKVDRGALPWPVQSPTATETPKVEDAPHRPLADSVEEKVCRVFEDVLGQRPIGPHDDFFEVGGDSLQAVELVYMLEDAFECRLPLAPLFEEATAAHLATVLRRVKLVPSSVQRLDDLAEGKASLGSLVEIRTAGERSALFVVPGGHGGMAEMTLYARVLSRIPDCRPAYGFMARGLDGRYEPHSSALDMAVDYVHLMRRLQPKGPYALAGACSGGTVAWEMARQLLAAGEEVELLLLLDAWCPSRAGELHLRWVETPRVLLHDRCSLGRREVASLHEIAVDNLRAVQADRSWRQIKGASGNLIRTVRGALARMLDVGTPCPGQDRRTEHSYVKVLNADRPRPYPGTAILITPHSSSRAGQSQPWRRLAQGGLVVHTVPGTHDTYLDEDDTIDKLHGCLQPSAVNGFGEVTEWM